MAYTKKPSGQRPSGEQSLLLSLVCHAESLVFCFAKLIGRSTALLECCTLPELVPSCNSLQYTFSCTPDSNLWQSPKSVGDSLYAQCHQRLAKLPENQFSSCVPLVTEFGIGGQIRTDIFQRGRSQSTAQSHDKSFACGKRHLHRLHACDSLDLNLLPFCWRAKTCTLNAAGRPSEWKVKHRTSLPS